MLLELYFAAWPRNVTFFNKLDLQFNSPWVEIFQSTRFGLSRTPGETTNPQNPSSREKLLASS